MYVLLVGTRQETVRSLSTTFLLVPRKKITNAVYSLTLSEINQTDFKVRGTYPQLTKNRFKKNSLQQLLQEAYHRK